MRKNPASNDSLTLTTFDMQRLEPLLVRHTVGVPLSAHLRVLMDKLAACLEIPSSEVSGDVVTMRSRVRLRDLESASENEFELVFPAEADPQAGRISVLAPLGVSLIGERVGRMVDVTTPRGIRRLLVDTLLFQPEAAGRYDL